VAVTTLAAACLAVATTKVAGKRDMDALLSIIDHSANTSFQVKSQN
jgi:hypothetical protein